MSPNKEGVDLPNPEQIAASETEDANAIKSKDPKTRKSLRWQVEGDRDKYLDSLEPTATRPIKRSIAEEYQIVTYELH